MSHTKLLIKLARQFSFSSKAVDLIKSYLINRKQCVCIDGENSDLIDIVSGVPQGSVLGPILFSLFINDLPTVLRHCRIHLFADDVQIYFDSVDLPLNEMARIINLDLSKIHDWSMRNLLPLNAVKSRVMFISRSRCPPALPSIRLGNDDLEYVNKFTNLGIVIQNNLEWEGHINLQCSKIYGSLRSLRITANMLPSAVKLRIFKSLILPHLSYGCEFLTNASARAIDRLRVALNCCIRWIFNLSRYDSVTHYQQQLLGCSFHNFLKLRYCLALFKIVNTEKPSYLFDKLRPFQGTRNRNFILCHHNTSHYGGTLFVRGIVNWNLLPSEIKSIRNYKSFRREVTTWLATRN